MATDRSTVGAVIRRAEAHVATLKELAGLKMDMHAEARRQYAEAKEAWSRAQSKLAMLKDSVAYFEEESR